MFDCEKGKHVPDLFYLRHMRANWTQMRVTGCIAQRQVWVSSYRDMPLRVSVCRPCEGGCSVL